MQEASLSDEAPEEASLLPAVAPDDVANAGNDDSAAGASGIPIRAGCHGEAQLLPAATSPARPLHATASRLLSCFRMYEQI